MIIGNGLLGRAFLNNEQNYENFIIFVSGVSDSLNSDKASYEREKLLLIKTLKEQTTKKLIYFSSVLSGVIDNNYYNHKLEIENLIKIHSNNYIIFRVPQIIGKSGNKNNLFNNFKNIIINGGEVTVYKDVYRSLLDVDDLVKIVDYFKDTLNNEIINISDIEKISVLDIVTNISKVLKKTPNIKLIKKHDDNNWVSINDIIVDEAINNIGINRIGYTDNVIKKYINN